MDNTIKISNLNDFIFCPASIYFHSLYGSMDNLLYHNKEQIAGKSVHKTIDDNLFGSGKDIICSLDIYSEHFNITGKIDIYNVKEKKLIERKRQVKVIYDGYIFQIYAQYYAMTEMDYPVEKLEIYSYKDNKTYKIKLPCDDPEMDKKFRDTIIAMMDFNLEQFVQTNVDKCRKCVYEPACDRSLL